MQSFPGFAERADAAFGSALGAGSWRVADKVAHYAAGKDSDSDAGDVGEEAAPAFCKAFEAEPEEAAEDILARAESSPPHHRVVAFVEQLEDDGAPPGRTVYVLDEPLFVGSGASRGEERGAIQPTAARATAHDAAPARPPQEPVKFQGASNSQRRGVLPDARASLRAAREGAKRSRASAPAKPPAVAVVPSTADDADVAGDDEEEEAAGGPAHAAPPGGRKKQRKLRRTVRGGESDDADA